MSSGAEIVSGALGHGAVTFFPDLPYLEWQYEYEFDPLPDIDTRRNNIDYFLQGCEKLHILFRKFLSVSHGFDDGTSGVEFNRVRDRIRDILAFQHGKNERSENWRNKFQTGQLEIQPNEPFPLYEESRKAWDKQRINFAGLDRPEKAANLEVYHFYQAADYHKRFLLRELFPKHGLIVV